MTTRRRGLADIFPVPGSQPAGATRTSEVAIGGPPLGVAFDVAEEIATYGQVSPLDGSGNFNMPDPNSPVYGGSGRVGPASISRLNRLDFPTEKSAQIARAQSWLEEDDLLQQLVGVKLDFTMSGFGLQCKPPTTFAQDAEPTPEEQKTLIEFRQRVHRAGRKHDLRKIAFDLARDFCVTESMILYWRTDDTYKGGATSDYAEPVIDGSIPGLLDICALNPADVDWDNSLGMDKLLVKIPKALAEMIHTAINKREPEKTAALAELAKKGVTQKWLDAVTGKNVKTGKPGYVELDRQDGDNWLIRTKGRKRYGLAKPSMTAIFLSLALRRAFIEGDYLAAFMMKHFIMMIQSGESIETGPNTGSRANWLTTPDANELLKAFTGVNKAMRMALNHTVKISFVFPPKEMFSLEKYTGCEQRIYNWAGIVTAVMTGSGGTYAGGFIGIKKLVANVIFARDELSLIFGDFFEHETIAKPLNIPADFEVVAKFDENILKEPKQLLDEIKAMVTAGFLDPRTSLRALGYDPEMVKSLKLLATKENEVYKVWMTLAEAIRSMEDEAAAAAEEAAANAAADQAAKDPGGRPPNSTTTQSEATRTQSPPAS